MNGKLRDALSSDKHPFIEYRFKAAEKLAGEGVKLQAICMLKTADRVTPKFEVRAVPAPIPRS